MWFKVYADGSEIDIIYANSPSEAIMIAKITVKMPIEMYSVLRKVSDPSEISLAIISIS